MRNSLEKAGQDRTPTPADKTMRQFSCVTRILSTSAAAQFLQRDLSNESSARVDCRCKTEELCRLQSQGAKHAQYLCLGTEVIISVKIGSYINKPLTNCI